MAMLNPSETNKAKKQDKKNDDGAYRQVSTHPHISLSIGTIARGVRSGIYI